MNRIEEQLRSMAEGAGFAYDPQMTLREFADRLAIHRERLAWHDAQAANLEVNCSTPLIGGHRPLVHEWLTEEDEDS